MTQSSQPSRRDAIRLGAQTTGLAALGLAGRAAGAAQDQAAPALAAPAAKTEDVATLEAVIEALYAAISGPAGARDWDRLRSLFHAGARLMPTARGPGENDQTTLRVLTVEEFVTLIKPNVAKEGFFEREIARRVERFGAVAHVFSTYESRHAADDAKPFTRGINSIQLFCDGKRWWVVTIYWDRERPDQPIPGEYLPKA